MAKSAKKKRANGTRKPRAAVEPPARPVISQSKLRSLMSSARRVKNDVSEITGAFGQEVKTAEENNHLNRKAFKTITMLDRMEPEKLAAWWEDFQHYFDISGLAERAESAPRMSFEDEGGEGASDAEAVSYADEPQQDDATVHEFPQAAA